MCIASVNRQRFAWTVCPCHVLIYSWSWSCLILCGKIDTLSMIVCHLTTKAPIQLQSREQVSSVGAVLCNRFLVERARDTFKGLVTPCDLTTHHTPHTGSSIVGS